MDIQKINQTIKYYNNNAEEYYKRTKDVDFSDIYGRFLKYIPKGGEIADLGCGSGRDVAYFASKGYKAIGIDASEDLAKISSEKAGIRVIVADMSTWLAYQPLDGIWCCASILHLDDEGLEGFFGNLQYNLKKGGALFISVKTGISTGIDNSSRYMRNFDEGEIKGLIEKAGLAIKECWYSADNIGRYDTKWINVIGIR